MRVARSSSTPRSGRRLTPWSSAARPRPYRRTSVRSPPWRLLGAQARRPPTPRPCGSACSVCEILLPFSLLGKDVYSDERGAWERSTSRIVHAQKLSTGQNRSSSCGLCPPAYAPSIEKSRGVARGQVRAFLYLLRRGTPAKPHGCWMASSTICILCPTFRFLYTNFIAFF